MVVSYTDGTAQRLHADREKIKATFAALAGGSDVSGSYGLLDGDAPPNAEYIVLEDFNNDGVYDAKSYQDEEGKWIATVPLTDEWDAWADANTANGFIKWAPNALRYRSSDTGAQVAFDFPFIDFSLNSSFDIGPLNVSLEDGIKSTVTAFAYHWLEKVGEATLTYSESGDAVAELITGNAIEHPQGSIQLDISPVTQDDDSPEQPPRDSDSLPPAH